MSEWEDSEEDFQFILLMKRESSLATTSIFDLSHLIESSLGLPTTILEPICIRHPIGNPLLRFDSARLHKV
jgi:hypothetical protein